MSSDQQQFTRRMGRGMIVVMWVVLITTLTWFFSDFLAGQHNPNQQLVTRSGPGGTAETVLQRNRYGHYVASGAINGQPVRFLLDTGATDVNIPGGVARRLGLESGAARPAQTANGRITVYATRLESVRLGEIELREVRASINPHMDGEDILLGMSFLKNLELVQRGDTLTLRQH